MEIRFNPSSQVGIMVQRTLHSSFPAFTGLKSHPTTPFPWEMNSKLHWDIKILIMTFEQPIWPETHLNLTARNILLSRTVKLKQALQGLFSQDTGCHSKLTQIVDPIGMRPFRVIFLHKREVMRGFCHHVAMILPCVCEQFPKLAPGMSLYIERFQFGLLLPLDLLLSARSFEDLEARLFSFHGCCHVACCWKNRTTEIQHHLPAAQQTPKPTAKVLEGNHHFMWDKKPAEWGGPGKRFLL